MNLLKSFCGIHSITHFILLVELKQLNLRAAAVVILSNHLSLLFAVIIFAKKPKSSSWSLQFNNMIK